jgi:hypothetical protein
MKKIINLVILLLLSVGFAQNESRSKLTILRVKI